MTTIAAPPAPTRPAVCDREFCLTLRPRPGESLDDLFQRLADELQGATLLKLMIFGALDAGPAAADAMHRALGGTDWPVSWLEGGSCHGHPIAGLHAFAFTSGDVDRIRIDGHVVGSVFQDASARHCLLGGVVPRRCYPARADQTRHTLAQLEGDLAQAGFALGDLVRTWFYLDDILSWYNEFNHVRTEMYAGIQFRTGSLPASTGIGARNPRHTALLLGARALQPLAGAVAAQEIGSPLQCPAPAYGSSFSRAMEIPAVGQRLLTISGTASIAPAGATLWPDSIHRQVNLTMEIVAAILQSRGASLADVTRAVAYFKDPTDVHVFTDWCADNGLAEMPVICTHGTVCRPDLMFELEADAVLDDAPATV